MRIWVWNKSGSSLEWALVCQLQESKIALQWHMEVERKREKVDFGYWHSLCFSAESCIRHIVIWMHGRFAYAALHDVLYCLYTNRLKSPFQLIPSPLFYINMRMQASIQRGREIAPTHCLFTAIKPKKHLCCILRHPWLLWIEFASIFSLSLIQYKSFCYLYCFTARIV